MHSKPGLSPAMVGLIAAVITVSIWTSFIVIARASAQLTLRPLDIAFVRLVGAAAVLMPWGWWINRQAARAGQPTGWLGVSPLPARTTMVCGLFGGLLYGILVYSGFFLAPAAHASVLMPGSLPLWTALLALWLLRERVSAPRALGLAFIVGGDLLVGGASLLQAFDGGSVWRGDLLFMSAAMCWSCYSVLARRYGLGAVHATIAVSTFAALLYVPVFLLLVSQGLLATALPQAPWAEIIFQMLFMGVGSVVISGITFTMMIRHYGPVRSTMITAFVPGLSALGAVIFLGEPLGWNLWAGLALVTAGIMFGVRGVAPQAAAR